MLVFSKVENGCVTSRSLRTIPKFLAYDTGLTAVDVAVFLFIVTKKLGTQRKHNS